MINFIINKKIIKSLLIAILVFSASPLYAAPLDVSFVPDPLFGSINFLPGDEESGNIHVQNNSGSTQTVIVDAVNVLDTDGLGEYMNLVIEDGVGEIYNDSFSDFLSAGEVELSDVGDGVSDIYKFTISFTGSSDQIQDKSIGFDLCVGFLGGNLQCGVTPPPVVTPPGGGGGGGNGPPNETINLVISNERVTSIEIGDGNSGNGSAVIEWDTNLLATDRVIYGPISDGPNYPACLTSGPCYNLNILDTPNYGLPFSTSVSVGTSFSHIAFLEGLNPGERYSYRVISHASPDTVGFEHQFTLTLPTITPVVTPTSGGGGTTVTGSSAPAVEGFLPGINEVIIQDTNLQPAAALFGLPEGLFDFTFYCALIFLLILILIHLLWKLFDRLTDLRKDKYTDQERNTRYFQFTSSVNAIAIFIAIVVNYLCVVVPLALVLIIQLIFTGWSIWGTKKEIEDITS